MHNYCSAPIHRFDCTSTPLGDTSSELGQQLELQIAALNLARLIAQLHALLS